MQQKKKNTILTTAGEIEKVTLEEFIARIPMETAKDLVLQYNVQAEYASADSNCVYPDETGMPKEEDTVYVRNAILVMENSRHNNLLHIMDQVDYVSVEGKDRDEKFEHAAVICLENFGSPTHLVEISWNCFGMFCIDDFKCKIIDPAHSAILCYTPRRNVIFRAGF